MLKSVNNKKVKKISWGNFELEKEIEGVRP